jgi:hypothetical protein
MTATTAAGEWVPLAEAARRLGLNVDQVRRRLRSGEVRGRKTPSKRGGPARYEVWVEAQTFGGRPDGTPGGSNEAPGDPPGARAEAPGAPPGGHQVPEGAALAAARAAEMAAYTRALLEPLHTRLEAQAERIGRLEADLEHTRAELAAERAERERWEAVLAEAEAAQAAEAAPRRPWWRFWRREAPEAPGTSGAVAASP